MNCSSEFTLVCVTNVYTAPSLTPYRAIHSLFMVGGWQGRVGSRPLSELWAPGECARPPGSSRAWLETPSLPPVCYA
jgi:hypothetical protein